MLGYMQIPRCSLRHRLSDTHTVIFLSHYPVCRCVLGNSVLIGCLLLPVPGHQGNHILNTSVAELCISSQKLRVYVKKLLADTLTGSSVLNMSGEFLLPFYRCVIKLFSRLHPHEQLSNYHYVQLFICFLNYASLYWLQLVQSTRC